MRIMPSEIEGEIVAPSSKSAMQRAVAIAALADGKTTITNPSFCDDSLAAIGIVKILGATVEVSKNQVVILGNWTRHNPKLRTLNCNESGLCMRMFSPIAALYSKKITLTGNGSLLARPVSMIEEPLKALGATVQTRDGCPPVIIKGPIRGGRIKVDGSTSSQLISGLLIALPLCGNDSELELVNLKSRGYVTMTESIVSRFGGKISRTGSSIQISGGQSYEGVDFRVEGDWSGASFILVAGAIAGKVKVKGIDSGSQPDQAIVKVLKAAGADVKIGVGSVEVAKAELNAFEFDATDSPDLFPPLVALACNCNGKSLISGVGRLFNKESNRAAVLIKEFSSIGAEVKVVGDMMEVTGKRLCGGTIDSHGDHRIAMACAIAALTSEKGVEIQNYESVSKSYPKFFGDLNMLMNGKEEVVK
jgi:3-phosphoshikimate 1-carboxyvinyltransferase